MAEGRSLALSNDDMKEILGVTKASHPTETPVDEILKRMKEDIKELLKVSNASRPAVILTRFSGKMRLRKNLICCSYIVIKRLSRNI